MTQRPGRDPGAASLRISLVINWWTWWGKNFPPDLLEREDVGSIAGGETHLLESAFGLAEAGHDVTVYSDLIRPSAHRGVRFEPLRAHLRAWVRGEAPDVLIAYMQPGPLAAVPPETTRIFVQQCNDLDYYGPWQETVDAIVAASASHALHLATLRGESGAILYTGPFEVVHNGCHRERYPEEPAAPQDRAPIVGYWSSPDRGLHHLLAAWPYVRRLRPDARLRIHYEVERVLKDLNCPIPAGRARLATLRDRVRVAQQDPTVTFTGMLARPAMRRAQLETRVMCYPLDPIAYTEGCGSSVSEAMAAGALPLLRPADAFPSLYSGGARWIEGTPSHPDFPRDLAEQIVRGLDWNGAGAPNRSGLRTVSSRWTWTNARAEMVRVVERAVARKRGEPVPDPAFPLEDPTSLPT